VSCAGYKICEPAAVDFWVSRRCVLRGCWLRVKSSLMVFASIPSTGRMGDVCSSIK
jgi:hypothetical protein